MGSLSSLDIPKLHHGQIRHASNALRFKAAAGAKSDSPRGVWQHQVQLLLPCHMGRALPFSLLDRCCWADQGVPVVDSQV